MNNTDDNTTETTDDRYGIYRKRTRSGRVRYYYFDGSWRLRLMGAEKARLDVEMGLAVFSTEVPFSATSPESWLTS